MSGLRVVLRVGFGAARRHRGLTALFLATTLLQGALHGALIWALRAVLIALEAPAESAGRITLAAAAGVILGLSMLRAGAAYAAQVLAVRLAHRVEIETMWDILDRLLRLPLSFFHRSSQGDLIMASYHDLKGVRNVTMQLGQVLLYGITLIGLAAAAFLMSPKLALVGTVLVPVGLVPAYWLGQRITRAAEAERMVLRTLHDSFLQVATGIPLIRVNRAERRILADARVHGASLIRQLVRQAEHRGLARFLLEAISGLGVIAVLVIGAQDVAAGRLPWQSLLGLLVAVMAVYSPVVGLIQTYAMIRSTLPNLDRTEQILAEPIAPGDEPGALPLAGPPETIELERVSFSYGDAPVLRDVSVTFRRGETIGIVGPSGAGKSTLLHLLLRFHEPTAGSIRLDGVDLRRIRRSDLMAQAALVLQEPFLFVATVAENVRIGRTDATDDEVEAAVRAVGLHDDIVAMRLGYDTVIGRGADGRLLSGGQKQRLCIAAAMLKNAPILLLDEATSSLDSLSERAVQASLDRLMQGRTTFVVAHRLSTLRHVDRILVLEAGQVAGFGTHAELMAACPTYAALWRAQAGGRAGRTVRPHADAEVVDA